MERDSRRSGWQIMKRLIVLIYPLMPYMFLAVFFGVLGFVFGLAITVLGTMGILKAVSAKGVATASYSFIFWGMVGAVVLRGLSRYTEQMANHYIAFRILATLRDQVFRAMRKLAPAKLEGKNTGDLLSMITGDMELLEVFYAHTISPIWIAFFCMLLFSGFLFSIHWAFGLVGFVSYLVIGVWVPLVAAQKSKQAGVAIRKEVGQLNGRFLDLMRGLREIIQFGQHRKSLRFIETINEHLSQKQINLKEGQGRLLSWVDGLSIGFTLLTGAVGFWLIRQEAIQGGQLILAILTHMASFGPFAALAALGNTLSQTLACGDRLITLLDEVPSVQEITQGKEVSFGPMTMQGVSFRYGETQEAVLKQIDWSFVPGEIVGLSGKSGCGKSTMLKLLMRFWDPTRGQVSLSSVNLKEINTKNLWQHMSYMTQSSVFFEGTLRENLLIANEHASDEAIKHALAQASILDFVKELPAGLDTTVAELGENFSGGEQQRMGLARCFLSEAKLMLLDEPTSNLDAQNEAVILKSLWENKGERTVVLVSHRESTTKICSRISEIKEGTLL